MVSETVNKRTVENLKTKVGQVISISGNKSIRVEIMNKVKHRVYKKYILRRTKLVVHDEHNTAGVGDLVEIVSTRPLSKTKAHRLLRVIKAAETENEE